MASGTTNGATGTKQPLELDQSFTDSVKASVGPKCEPRLRQLFCGLVQHMHDFVRENEVTMDEFLMGIDMVGGLLIAPLCSLQESFSART